MRLSVLSMARKWGLHVVLGIGLLGFGFAIAENFFPSFRPRYQSNHFCRAVTPGMSIDEVQQMQASTGYKATQQIDAIQVSVGGGCVCVVKTDQQRVTNATLRCPD